jgi:dTMP kinase
MVTPPGRGALIAIEGIDGAGTTTQARLLVEWLQQQGLPAHLTCEPSSGPVGELLRRILKGQGPWTLDAAAVALLFAADRVDHYQHEMRPLLEAGTHVVTDRSVYSSLAYQSIEQDLAWVESINCHAPEPDLTVYLRISPDQARVRRMQRGGPPELFDDHELQQRISARYDEILGSRSEHGSWRQDPAGSGWIRAGSAPEIRPGTGRARAAARHPECAILDGSQPADSLHRLLRVLVEKVARSRRT